jgi:NitT/TauT family transport system ATP-binding protein
LSAVIQVGNVSKSFATPTRGRIEALVDIDFEVHDGEFLCLLGPSGCGKSTLLNIIAGIDTPTLGDIRFPHARPRMAMVFQQALLLPWRTVRSNVRFSLESWGDVPRLEWDNRVDRAVKLVGLEGFEEYFPRQLSGGMQTRVSIARALAIDPGVLLMDEPFGALDEMTRRRMHRELLGIWEKTRKTVTFVTHSVSEAVYLADRILILTPRPGRIKANLRVEVERPRAYGDDRLYAMEKVVLRELEA